MANIVDEFDEADLVREKELNEMKDKRDDKLKLAVEKGKESMETFAETGKQK